jgi:hypothetical protein
MQVNLHEIKDYALGTIATCSVLHTVLPPWDWDPDFVRVGLAEFPMAQAVFRKSFNNRYYKLLIYTLGYIAINGRSTVWKVISIKNQLPQANGQK